MRIVFLGTGSAFGPKWQSNILIFSDNGSDDTLLLDCGGDIRHALKDHGMGLHDIRNLYISHLHGDHVGGIEGVALVTYFIPGVPRPKLYCEANLMSRLWKESLKGGLQTLEDLPAKLDNFFEPVRLKVGVPFEWQEFVMIPVQTVHVYSQYKQMPNFGLLIKDTLSGKTIFFTADTLYDPKKIMHNLYDKADLILHDCETNSPPIPPSGVHAHFNDLKSLDIKYKKKMLLYHYTQDYINYDAVGEGFLGFAQESQVISIDPSGKVNLNTGLFSRNDA